MQYYDIPADIEQSIELAHIVKYTCAEAYDCAGGIDFTRAYFPKLFTYYGEFEYENNGSIKLGTAEGGKKIRLLGVNHLNSENYVTGYLKRGFITAYSQKEAREDFAEMVSTYVITSESDWKKMMIEAGSTGSSLIEKKLDICKRYYKETFKIELDDIRDEVVRRENDVIKGLVDLTDITVNE